ncbi:MAG TPA: hypothetical protein DCE42_28510 [Myxococcales bacterium]|nr:hypothetical protein [Deltaproteobacteria bacterium]MBU54539.1 hypothetical protein [Deltaproteobacteria bacterium]HAA58738.1 hypothetical protein [Myxococcales bacterium]|tara:strand:+ start:1458 stop:2867 length:1410 start_codon:yes stop_codon:yes gene_type:complete
MDTAITSLSALAHNTPFVPSEDALELRVWVSKTLKEQQHYYKAQEITFGPKTSHAVQLDASLFGYHDEELTILRPEKNRLWVYVTEKMKGWLQVEDRLYSLDEIEQSNKAEPTEDGFRFVLPHRSRCSIEFDAIRIELGIIAAPKRWPLLQLNAFDGHMGRALGMSFVLHGVILLTMLMSDTAPENLGDQYIRQGNRFEALILRPEQPKPQPERPRAGGKSAKGAKGEAGQKDAPKVRQKMSSVEKKVNANSLINTSKLANDIKQKIHKTGLFKGMGKSFKSLLTLRGMGGQTFDARGGWRGVQMGESRGNGGFAFRGVGPGAGAFTGNGGSFATGSLLASGGKGRFRGKGRLRKKSGKLITITKVGPSHFAEYPKELIRRTIKMYRAQIRYCYERELIKHRQLRGQVALFFQINPTGSLSRVRIRKSTLNNDRVEDCLVRRARFWKFPAPKSAGIVHVTYPFYFQPSR